MIARTIAATLALGLAATTFAQTPNIEPGLWTSTNTVTFSGDVPIPDQSSTDERCVTAEEISDGLAFLEGMEDCEFSQRDLSSSRIDFQATCDQPDGTRMTTSGTIEFGGDTSSAVMNASMESPLGPMDMTIEMNSERIGDC